MRGRKRRRRRNTGNNFTAFFSLFHFSFGCFWIIQLLRFIHSPLLPLLPPALAPLSACVHPSVCPSVGRSPARRCWSFHLPELTDRNTMRLRRRSRGRKREARCVRKKKKRAAAEKVKRGIGQNGTTAIIL